MNLPDNFQPFTDLAVCSNRFIKGITPFAIGDQPILLVGNGDLPSVWLSVPSSTNTGEFLSVIVDNQSRHSQIHVEICREERRVIVKARETIVISVRKILDEFAAVESIDLRPLGLSIHGSEGGLHIGGMSLVGNRSEGASVMVGLGQPDFSQ